MPLRRFWRREISSRGRGKRANSRFRPRWAELKASHVKAERPIRRRGDRGCSGLTHLLVVSIEDDGEKRGGQNIEDNGIDVRMPFDQSQHSYPLPARCGFFFPLRASLDGRESSRELDAGVADFILRAYAGSGRSPAPPARTVRAVRKPRSGRPSASRASAGCW